MEAREALDGIITAYKISVLSYSNTPEKEIDKALRPFIKRLDEEFDRLVALERVTALPHNALIHKHITAQADLATAKTQIGELETNNEELRMNYREMYKYFQTTLMSVNRAMEDFEKTTKENAPDLPEFRDLRGILKTSATESEDEERA